MKPGLEAILPGLAVTFAFKVIPVLPETSYALGDVRISAAILLLAAQQADKGAHILFHENKAIRQIFSELGEVGLDAELKTRLLQAARGQDEDLRITVLEASNAALQTDLIALQTAIETREEPVFRALNRRIWNILIAGTEARMLELPAV